jgi:hypothetical protein
MQFTFKKIFLIVIVIGITIFLLSRKNSGTSPSPAPDISKAQTTLSFSPNPIVISSQKGTANIVIDTGENTVKFVQIKLSYNPIILYDMQIKKDLLFSQADVLNTYRDDHLGTITYILNFSKKISGFHGKGNIAEISFKTHLANNESTNLSFTRETMVSDATSPQSILKKVIDTKIIRKDK